MMKFFYFCTKKYKNFKIKTKIAQIAFQVD